MTDLEKARQKINQVDNQMRELFLERMKASQIVAEYKKLHGMQIFDPQREAEVIARNISAFKDEKLSPITLISLHIIWKFQNVISTDY
jgi:chorismate mutase/prephenate dehydratase